MVEDQTVPDLPGLLHELRRREARRRGGPELTYRELAAKTGWSLGIIAQYFSGKTLPPIDRFDVLIRLLGASPAEQGMLATARDRVDEHRRRGRDTAPDGCVVRILGPVRVVGPRGVARLVGVRQRTLVGLLALQPGRVATQTRLVDALWGDDPPRTAVRTLYSHVARVRRALDACGLPRVLRTQGSGYLLAVRPEDVDAARFEARVASARKALAGGAAAEAVTRLRAGLALWQGDALADAAPHGWGAAEIDRLHEVRLSAQEDMWAAQLGLGKHAGVVGELEKSMAAQPGRERSAELLMRALYQCGRPADALDVYQRLRERLADQLGADPGATLQRLHTAILRRDPSLDLDRSHHRPETPVAPRPAQLPPQAGHFTGRTAELAALDELRDAGPRVGIVHGPAGMGKTALAVQWASRAADGYPDGLLFLDLRGHDPAAALPVTDALTHLLVGLGVPAAQVPTDATAQVGLYRSALHHRRVLVLLDNAATADQIAPLVPPAPSRLLVTSRNRLTGLAVDHAVTAVDLDVLPADDALALLGRVLGAERVAGEPAASGRLVELCGQMPLALRIAAAKLTARPGGQIAALVTELSGADRLDALSVPGDSRSIRTAFAGAYRALSGPAARLFRRLGQQPGPTFGTSLAAALAGVAHRRAKTTLDELTTAHLVAEVGPDRFRFHDLIGRYARECAAPAERERARTRVIDWYLVIGDAANRVLEPGRNRVGTVSVHPPIEAPFPADRDQALAFLDAERANLMPAVRLATEHGDDRAAWRLTYLLTGYHSVRGHWSAQVELGRLGLVAAQRLNDPTAEALMRSWLGFACNATQAHEEALEHLGVALRLMRANGDSRGQGSVLNNIAVAYGQLGRLDAAMDTFVEVLALHRANNHQPGIAAALNNIGDTYLQMGQPDLARPPLRRALVLARRLGLAGHEAYHLHSLGEAHRAAADPDGALRHFNAALAIRRGLGEWRLEAETLTHLGLAHRDRGDHAAAAVHFRRALELGRELGDRYLEASAAAHLERSESGQGDHGDRVGERAGRNRGDLDAEPPRRRVRRLRQ